MNTQANTFLLNHLKKRKEEIKQQKEKNKYLSQAELEPKMSSRSKSAYGMRNETMHL